MSKLNDIDVTCNCVGCEENVDGKCTKKDTRWKDYFNKELGYEYYYPFCDYRNNPDMRAAYDDGYDDGYRAAY